MVSMSVLVLCPSRGRPDKAKECLASFMDTRKEKTTRLVFVLDDDDETRADYPGEVYVTKAGGSYAPALNHAAKDERLVGDATVIAFVGDDCRFRTVGWDRTLGKWLTENIGIGWADDGWDHPWPKEEKASHWFVSRPIVDAFGMVPIGLRHFYTDDFWAQLGWAAGCAKYFSDVLIEHLHPLARKAATDDIYDRPAKFAANDKRWFVRWQHRSKGVDADRVQRIIRAARADGPRRVLADWHHPALWESLEMLFSDRFGWELYSMTGSEWKRHGWKWEHNGSNADWFLNRPAKAVGEHFEIASAEYPKRPRKAVTFAQAESMRWDFVLGSVVVHQRSFSDLARKFNARFIHQIGNAHHYIDRSVPQIMLASAKVPLRGAVIYHQEFDRSLFRFRPSQHSGMVGSFMLRKGSAGCDTKWIEQSMGSCFREYGREIDDPAYIAPMSKVAETMAACDWIWHDKKIGDGYGHVLHNAAALGRPLIGHASHYKRLLGEPYWQDMKTAIDLDRHDTKEAARLIKAISRDPEWHDEMSRNIAAVFAKEVDFDAEAKTIRQALA